MTGTENSSVPDGFTLHGVGLRRSGTVLLDNVNAQLRRGHCTVVTGMSGSGKTTLLRLLNRLDDPTTGCVLLDGVALVSLDVLMLRRRVMLVGQQPVLLTRTVGTELRIACPLTEDQARHVLDQVGLPSSFFTRETSGLSGGEAQRVCLARALAAQPEVLLLDEPTSALDPTSTNAIEALISRLVGAGRTVVAVSHHSQWITRVAHHVLVLDRGHLTDAGPPPEIDYLRSAL